MLAARLDPRQISFLGPEHEEEVQRCAKGHTTGRYADGHCIGCKAVSDKQRAKDGLTQKAAREFRIRNRQRGLCACGHEPAPGRTRCSSCLDCQRTYRKRIKKECIDAYGGSCACCGEIAIDFLTLDHERNDGAQHREQVHGEGTTMYASLKKAGFPKDLGLQVLCWNCNLGKQINGGTCPHKVMNNEQ